MAAPILKPRGPHQPGVLNRQKILAAATSGIVGVILSERLLARPRAQAQPRGLFPWVSGMPMAVEAIVAEARRPL